MSILRAIQEQDNPITLGETSLSVPVIDRIGDGVLVMPSIAWLNNKTFWIGDITATGNNQLYCIEYDYQTGYTYKYVGIGTVDNDVFDHPAGFLFIYNDYIYCGQTNTHNELIDIYKSNSQGTISGGFTKIKVINGYNAYPQTISDHDGNRLFCVRLFGSPTYDFDLAIQRSDSANPNGTYTQTQITDCDNANYRHYNGVAMVYGTNTKNYFHVTHRNDTGQHYFAHSLLVTSDFATYSNYANTYSKNVVSTSAITQSELNTNYAFNGSSASDTADLKIMTAIQINDLWFGIALKSGTTDHYIFKLSGTTLTDTQISISNLNHSFINPFMYYDGTDILLSVCINNGGTQSKKIYRVPLDLSDFTDVVYSYEPTTMYEGTRPIMLPQNYNDISEGDYYVMYLDRNTTTDEMIVDIKNSLL